MSRTLLGVRGEIAKEEALDDREDFVFETRALHPEATKHAGKTKKK